MCVCFLPEPKQPDACQRRDDDGRDYDDDGTGRDKFPPSEREQRKNAMTIGVFFDGIG